MEVVEIDNGEDFYWDSSGSDLYDCDKPCQTPEGAIDRFVYRPLTRERGKQTTSIEYRRKGSQYNERFMNRTISRRALLAAATSAAALKAQAIPPLHDIVRRHDESIARLLKTQDTNPSSRWRGIFPDEYGLHNPATACGIISSLAAAYLQPASKYHRDAELVQRLRLAAGLLAREITPDGNLDNPLTNFNSPPDTAFGVRAMCTGAVLAQRQGERDLLAIMEPFLKKAGASLTHGGIHTPNHRWVVCAALSQLHEVFGEPGY